MASPKHAKEIEKWELTWLLGPVSIVTVKSTWLTNYSCENTYTQEYISLLLGITSTYTYIQLHDHLYHWVYNGSVWVYSLDKKNCYVISQDGIKGDSNFNELIKYDCAVNLLCLTIHWLPGHVPFIVCICVYVCVTLYINVYICVYVYAVYMHMCVIVYINI